MASPQGGSVVEIYESAEDYLEKILMLAEQSTGKSAPLTSRTEMGVTKPSVEHCNEKSASGRLYFDGWCWVYHPGAAGTGNCHPDLWPPQKADPLFVALGVDPAVASHDACKIEHDLSAETFEKLVAFAESQHMLKES